MCAAAPLADGWPPYQATQSMATLSLQNEPQLAKALEPATCRGPIFSCGLLSGLYGCRSKALRPLFILPQHHSSISRLKGHLSPSADKKCAREHIRGQIDRAHDCLPCGPIRLMRTGTKGCAAATAMAASRPALRSYIARIDHLTAKGAPPTRPSAHQSVDGATASALAWMAHIAPSRPTLCLCLPLTAG